MNGSKKALADEFGGLRELDIHRLCKLRISYTGTLMPWHARIPASSKSASKTLAKQSAQAKSSNEDDFNAYRKMLNQSEGGRAVLESFLMIWPTIEEAGEVMIETGDFSGNQFSAALQLLAEGLS